MGFALFLLVNLTLFVRPMEIVPDLEGVRLYEALILSSLVLSLPEILHFFSVRPLSTQPVTLCVFGLMCTTLLSKAAEPAEMMRIGEHFGKVVLYYVLAVGVLNSGARVRIFLAWILICIFLLTSIAVLQYYEVIQLPKLNSRLLDPEENQETGERKDVFRLQGTGIFQDPNELCGILAVAVPLCLWALMGRARITQPLWFATLCLSMFGIYLTRSRGGFLGLAAGLGVLTICKFGWRRALVLGMIGGPAALFAFGGRQTDISASEGTAKTRIQLWSDWLQEFRNSPIVGNGLNLPKEEESMRVKGESDLSHLAHNSYLQAYADWGFLGGTLFLGAFVLGIWGIARYGRGQVYILDPQLGRLQPFLLGALAAYAMSILSISVNDRVPTLLILSLACTFPLVTRSVPPVPPLQINGRIFGILMGISVVFLAFLFVFVRLFVSW